MENFEANIITGPPVYVRKKFCYVGHATTTYSVEQAASIVDYIGQKFDSDHSLPFAVRLVEGGELVLIAEDNGEFACGEILSSCLKSLEGFNVIVCVSKKVSGLFVTDMVQSQKHKAVKEAATKVLELLRNQLVAPPKRTGNDSVSGESVKSQQSYLSFEDKRVDLSLVSIEPQRKK